MANFFEDLWQWVLAVLTYWQAYATAGLVAALLAALEHFGLPISKRLYVIGAVTFLIVACFMSWREKHTALQVSEKTVQALQEEIQQEKNRKLPSLEGNIDAMFTGNIPEVKAVGAFLLISVKNIGDVPSIAEGGKLDVQYDGVTVTVYPTYFAEGLKLHGEDGGVIKEFHRANAFEEVTSIPIAPGAQVRGWAQYILNGVPSDLPKKSGVTWTFHFRDVRNREYIAVFTSRGKHEPPTYLPGFGDPLKLPQ